VAAQLGPQCLAITAAALAVAYVSAWNQGRWASGVIISIATPVLLPWLLGHAAYGSVSALSALMAGFFGLTFSAFCSAGTVNRRLVQQVMPQIGVAVCVVVGGQPVVAGVVTLLTTSQLLLAPLLETQPGRVQYFRLVQAPLVTSMLLAALALGHP
jgi:hypothetical protein